jgi:hypothetical protein
MSEPREVEVWPCDESAACLIPWCRHPATKVLRYVNGQGGPPYRQTNVCETHARELCDGMKVIGLIRRPSVPVTNAQGRPLL